MLNPETIKQSPPQPRPSQFNDPWPRIDNYYYPFLNPYIFPFDVRKNDPTFLNNHAAVKIEPTECHSQPNQITKGKDVDSPPLIKAEQMEEETYNKPGARIIVKDRNILSNNTNLILSLIRRKSKSQKIVTKIIGSLNEELRCDYSQKRFYSYQNYIKENVNDYRNKNAIQAIISHVDPACPIFSVPEQLFHNRVCRILIQLHIHNTFLLDVLNLKKIKKTNRGDHLKVQRYLTRVLQGPKSADYCELYKL